MPQTDRDKLVPEEPEKEPGLPTKIASYFSIILVSSLVGGAVGAFYRYFYAFTGTHGSSDYTTRVVQSDTTHDMKMRFVIGAIIGGAMALLYVLRPSKRAKGN